MESQLEALQETTKATSPPKSTPDGSSTYSEIPPTTKHFHQQSR